LEFIARRRRRVAGGWGNGRPQLAEEASPSRRGKCGPFRLHRALLGGDDESRPEICVDDAAFDRVAFHQEFNAALLAFFRKELTEK
jgi:hypothetical protein